MGTARRLYTDEFKQKALGLLASSGRLLSHIAGELGVPAAGPRAWRGRMTEAPDVLLRTAESPFLPHGCAFSLDED